MLRHVLVGRVDAGMARHRMSWTVLTWYGRLGGARRGKSSKGKVRPVGVRQERFVRVSWGTLRRVMSRQAWQAWSVVSVYGSAWFVASW